MWTGGSGARGLEEAGRGRRSMRAHRAAVGGVWAAQRVAWQLAAPATARTPSLAAPHLALPPARYSLPAARCPLAPAPQDAQEASLESLYCYSEGEVEGLAREISALQAATEQHRLATER